MRKSSLDIAVQFLCINPWVKFVFAVLECLANESETLLYGVTGKKEHKSFLRRLCKTALLAVVKYLYLLVTVSL